MPSPSPLIVFGDDHGRHPSSVQHLVGRLPVQRPVLWVNTIGMRRLRLRLADLRRVEEKVWQWFRPHEDDVKEVDECDGTRPYVINPVMWPGFGSRYARRVNRSLLVRAIMRAMKHLGMERPAVLTTLPITADLIEAIEAERWVYYMVDDFANWPGLDGVTLNVMEQEQLGKVDAVAAVSEPLMRRAREAGHDPYLLSHGIDSDLWDGRVAEPRHPVARELAEAGKPVAVFWGLIDQRIDPRAIEMLAESWDGVIALVGPVESGAEHLGKLPGVKLTGPVPHATLPQIAGAGDVLVMPYRDTTATRAMQPLKLKEYLSTEKPVVCLTLPQLLPWRRCCDLVTQEHFASCVIDRARSGLEHHERTMRRFALASESWNTKAEQLQAILDGGVAEQTRTRAA